MALTRGQRIATSKSKVFRFEGVDEVVKNLGSLRSVFESQEAKQVMMRGALTVRDEAKDLVPVRTGLLKSAIFAAYGDPTKSDVLVGVNSRRAPHAHLVEYGTSKMSPRPFMRPAIRATLAMVARIIAEGLKQIIDRRFNP